MPSDNLSWCLWVFRCFDFWTQPAESEAPQEGDDTSQRRRRKVMRTAESEAPQEGDEHAERGTKSSRGSRVQCAPTCAGKIGP